VIERHLRGDHGAGIHLETRMGKALRMTGSGSANGSACEVLEIGLQRGNFNADCRRPAMSERGRSDHGRADGHADGLMAGTRR